MLYKWRIHLHTRDNIVVIPESARDSTAEVVAPTARDAKLMVVGNGCPDMHGPTVFASIECIEEFDRGEER